MSTLQISVGTILRRTNVRRPPSEPFMNQLCGKLVRVIRVSPGNFEVEVIRRDRGRGSITGIPIKFCTEQYFAPARQRRPASR